MWGAIAADFLTGTTIFPGLNGLPDARLGGRGKRPGAICRIMQHRGEFDVATEYYSATNQPDLTNLDRRLILRTSWN